MSLSNGLLNLTNWLGNVIMPTWPDCSLPPLSFISAKDEITSTSPMRHWRP